MNSAIFNTVALKSLNIIFGNMVANLYEFIQSHLHVFFQTYSPHGLGLGVGLV